MKSVDAHRATEQTVGTNLAPAKDFGEQLKRWLLPVRCPTAVASGRF